MFEVADLDRLVQTATRAQDCPQATTILQGVPVYTCEVLRAAEHAAAHPVQWRKRLMAEWARGDLRAQRR